MTDRHPTVMYSANGDKGGIRQLPPIDEFTFTEDQPADLSTGLVSLGYLFSAIRRGLRLIGILTIAGLLIGVGSYVKSPPAFQASTSVLLTYGPNEAAASAIFDNQTIAESHAVAQLALTKLKIHDTVAHFAGTYTVAVITDRVLLITANAPTGSDAVSRANAIAGAFLQFRTNQAKTAQQVLVQSLKQEVTQARNNLATLNKEVSDLQAQAPASDKESKLKILRGQRDQAQINLSVVQQTAAGAQTGSSTLSAISGSLVLDAATLLPHSKTKGMVTYAAYGLIGGFAIGIGIVLVGAVTSDRLRRRDDVARAVGGPVRLSVGPVRLSGRLPRTSRGLEAADDGPVTRIAAHLSDVLTASRDTRLAVVAVDDPRVAALAVLALARGQARSGRKVVVADLAAGTPLARFLGSAEPGVRMVTVGDAQLMLAVPGPDEPTPAGPSGHTGAHEPEFTETVRGAAASADLLLSVASLDPSFGGSHLSSWSARTVAVVTAGRASWARIHATGEMLRLAGVSLVSTVLVGADRADESIGFTGLPDMDRPGIGELA